MAIEIIDLSVNSMVIFHSYVSLPEGSGNECGFHGNIMDIL